LASPQKSFSLKGFIARFDNETCREYLAKARWGNKPRCHQCGNNKNNYRYTTRPVYKCSNCGTQFRATTGTIFERSKIPLSDWFLAIKLMACSKKGLSSYQLAKELGITQKSAWYMETNIRLMLGNKEYKSMLGGIVEVDEVYMIRDTSKKTKQGHGTNKQKVFGMRERNSEKNESGELRITIVDKVNSKTLHPIIIENVELGAWLMSDEWKAYNNLEDLFERGVVNHSKRQYVNGATHTNSIEGAWSHLRRLVSGIYHRPSVKHLQKYLDEFEFRYNHRNKSLDLIFKTAIKQSGVRKKHTDIIL
jgi:transposase-like protein